MRLLAGRPAWATRDLAPGVRVVLGVVGLVVLLATWQAVVAYGLVPPDVLPAPTEIWPAWINEVSGGFWSQAVLDSLTHYSLGLLIGSALGVGAGLLCGSMPVVDALTGGAVRLLRPIPGLAWAPFAILWFGLNTAGATFIIAISVFWITFYAAYGAVRAIDRDLYEVAAAFGHGGFVGRMLYVVLPASAPGVMAGLRTGLGQGWMSVVAAELFGAPGVGARMLQASSLLATDVVVVYMVTMALLYALTDVAFGFLSKRALRWQG
ncbi:nitrate/sulfonate/bicarbonate ABC transporter permease [Acetobacter nitrogenifigens DSM 23921 = NBRC 105050]|uniref:Sulfonate ABC transporter n=1 Tax=Acetobacter nitrogenifigens DSM 23921 = NBRC 105050 TaxID=1120919 RepID=A0A511X9D8_9PROT|nr:ABC transporter permease [Acetobacter nitrogenifigens]GBQ93413.1 nitrate/sulfonate/bicarbonate ABC transporter permease [Acetobacter nitrogenifigens DSM 23921 = NBRC 105050]GEN59558.1 sulfonate ABC transporter [Acetobacter nitrogenifigens DSM 23921 = NBRC 105050]